MTDPLERVANAAEALTNAMHVLAEAQLHLADVLSQSAGGPPEIEVEDDPFRIIGRATGK